ncbi:MAG: 2,3-bisphosphoglycerate-independent phosphoglycerate mutase, partial [Microgenomates group bacterium]
WGLAPAGPGNAISLAHTPTMDSLWQSYPHTEIGAGGEAIGLPAGHQGSSDIGHLIIGAGRNVYLLQGQVAHAVSSGEIKINTVFLEAIDRAKKYNSTLHLAGLMSDKGVHSYDGVMHALIRMAAEKGVKDVIIHYFTDGRDTGVYETKKYLSRLEEVFKETGVGQVGTVMGRYWIMDRDHRFDRVEKGYKAMTKGEAKFTAQTALEAIDKAYERQETDEFIEPTVIVDQAGEPIGRIKDNDVLIWTNFRSDRSIEPTQAFTESNFSDFDRGPKPNIYFVGLYKYYDKMTAPFALVKDVPINTIGEIISKSGLRQCRIAETEKWIYVTTTFSGLREEPFPGEDRILIPSDKIATYDLAPKMHALDIAKAAVEAINSDQYELVMMNFANPDIIGHTGNMPATIEGIEECDRAVNLVVEATRAKNGLAIISADHGNAESMLTSENKMDTQHSANNVPLIIVSDDPAYKNIKLKTGGALQDVTPTILEILGIKKPVEMTGQSLIEK